MLLVSQCNSLTDEEVIADLLVEIFHQFWVVLPDHLDVVAGDTLENFPKEVPHLLIHLN